MNKLDRWLTEWANGIIRDLDRSGYSGMSILGKIIYDPGISTAGMRHRILWWPRNRRMSEISRAMHHVNKIEELCLIIKYGKPTKEDGRTFTKHDLAKCSSIDCARFTQITRNGRKKVKDALSQPIENKKKPRFLR